MYMYGMHLCEVKCVRGRHKFHGVDGSTERVDLLVRIANQDLRLVLVADDVDDG